MIPSGVFLFLYTTYGKYVSNNIKNPNITINDIFNTNLSKWIKIKTTVAHETINKKKYTNIINIEFSLYAFPKTKITP